VSEKLMLEFEAIIPEELTMNGTIRTLNSEVQDMIHKRVKEVVTAIESAGAKLKLRLQNKP
jgi:metal-dependent amidase/aminoacylase/carboxypeptidase family protein